MRKFYTLSIAMVLTGLMAAHIPAQDDKKPADDKKVEQKDDKGKKDGDKKDGDPKKDEEKPKDGDDKAKKEDDKAKAEKKKKERAEKLEKSFADFKVDGKVVKFDVAFFEYAVGYNVVTMGKKDYKTYAYVAYPTKSGLAGEAHMGQLTGWIGTNNGWAVFGAQTGSGLALKKAATVIFVPQNEDGTFGTPVEVTGQDIVNGFTPYLVEGDGTGQYWVKTK